MYGRQHQASVKNGTWCPVCIGKHQDIRDMHKLAEARGGKCLSSKYINNRTKLTWQCEKGHIWEATPHNIRNDHWCPECGGSKKLTLKDMHKLAENQGEENVYRQSIRKCSI